MRRTAIVLTMVLSTICSHAQQMTLQQCLDSALTYNRRIISARLDLTSAKEQRKDAFTNYFPEVSANIMAFHSMDKMIKGNGTYPDELSMLGEPYSRLSGQPYSIEELNKGYSAAITLTMPLYAGGQITTGNRLAKIQEDVTDIRMRMTEKDVTQNVTECYWQLACLQYKLNTLYSAEKLVDALHQQVEQYVRNGVTTRNDLLKIDIRKKEIEGNKVRLTSAINVMTLSLANQIGMNVHDITIDVNDTRDIDLPTYADSRATAEKRDELLMAERNVEAKKNEVSMQRAKSMPKVAVGVSAYHSGFGGISETIKRNIDTKMTNGVVFGTMSIPISEWWSGSHGMRQKKALHKKAENEYEEIRESLCVDIENAWSEVLSAYKQYEISRSAVTQTEENLRIMTEQYKAGTTHITDLLDAEALNRQAHDEESQAKASYQIKLNDYKRKTNEI